MGLTTKQVQDRKSALGSSDAGTALGVNPWRTPLELFYDKTNEGLAELKTTLPMQLGSLFEDAILTLASEQLEVQGRKNVVRVHPEHPWWKARLDKQVEYEGHKVPLEAKFGRDGEEWGNPMTADVPIFYLTQVYHQMLAMDAPVGFLAAVLVSDFGPRMTIYRFERADDLDNMVTEGLVDFWKHVEHKQPPEGSVTPEFAKRIKRVPGTAIPVSNQAVKMFIELKKIGRDAEKAIKDHEAQMLGLMGDAEALAYLSDENELRVHWWREESAGTRFDYKGFKEAHPELAEQIAKFEIAATRRMWRDKKPTDLGMDPQPLLAAISEAEVATNA